MKIELTVRRDVSHPRIVQAEAKATVRGTEYKGAASAGGMQSHTTAEEAAVMALRLLLRAVSEAAVLDE